MIKKQNQDLTMIVNDIRRTKNTNNNGTNVGVSKKSEASKMDPKQQDTFFEDPKNGVLQFFETPVFDTL